MNCIYYNIFLNKYMYFIIEWGWDDCGRKMEVNINLEKYLLL